MPTRIFFTNGEQVTVSDAPDAVAEKLGTGAFARLDRPWGDESIFVNPSAINYIEAQDERAPDIAALEAVPDSAPAAAPTAPQPPQAPPSPGAPGAPGGFPGA